MGPKYSEGKLTLADRLSGLNFMNIPIDLSEYVDFLITKL